MNSSETIRFYCRGHGNIRGTHSTTFEFTKDKEISPRGDCIIGVDADFNLDLIKKCLAWKEATITLKIDDIEESIDFIINTKFSDNHEIVIRMGEFESPRTLGVRSNKGSKMLNRELIEKLKNPESKLLVILNEKETTKKI